MSTRYNTTRRKAIRNLRSAGWEGAKFTARVAEKSAEGLFRWATTDHTGMSKALINMPDMGFVETIKCILLMLSYSLVYALAMGVAVFVTFAYWIPFLLGLIFG
jgi:hypothetical protein